MGDATDGPDPIANALLGRSVVMRRLAVHVDAAARSRANVLITGERGTGKELIARRIHALSSRRNRPFLHLDCAALPQTSLDADLFGDERAGRSGPARDARLLELDGGTLFLDDVSELSPGAQGKLIELLSAGTFTPLGAVRPRQVDVRVVSSTHKDLRPLVSRKRFRVELLYRLKVLHLEVPPLRERIEDVELLANHFLLRAAAERAQPLELGQSALKALLMHPFPGNVRELEEAIAFAAASCSGGVVNRKHLPREIAGDSSDRLDAIPSEP
jgi:DNA-binding NtrC family response regulator